MADLIYSVIASLDGYTADEGGRFDWAAPDDEVHRFVNDIERSVGTYLYGRRMYEVMAGWQTMDGPGYSDVARDFARIWQAADKIVYSRTLPGVTTPRTRLVPEFEPDAVLVLKQSTDRDISVGGPNLAAHALVAGLVDECQVFVVPHIVGGGTPWLPTGFRSALALLDQRRFEDGTVYLRYRVTS